MTLPANIRTNMSAPFPATVRGSGLVSVAKTNGVWTVGLNFASLVFSPTTPDPLTTYALVYDTQTGTLSFLLLSGTTASKSVKILNGAGAFTSPYAAQPGDDVLIVKQAAGAPFTVTVDWSQRTKPLRIVDGKGDANINNITITPAAGQTQMASVNYSYIIDGAGGSITLTPLPDNTGAY